MYTESVSNFNKVILLGNLTRDVEVRYAQSGTAIGKFGMALNSTFKSKDGNGKETTCFVDLTAFGKTAEILAQYVSKGSPLFVEGRLESSSWEGKDGTRRSKLEVVVENFQFIGSRGDGGSAPKASRSTKTYKRRQPSPPMDDDIPF